ncbi:csbD-like domain-containing protein [Fusarium heterosporum]|uniref:CsbD-like domain-containing protein n=1 Tax=Fusarium heterosporum TaxID=42747 RepID=A0A8H5WNX6_FUSHE|nr:csbD-like domain-containing protein [Fusarium heterosporum]
MADNTNNNQQPGLIGSHAQYVKGAAEATIGAITGSQPWKASGEQDKAAGLADMKKAGELRAQSDPNTGYGKAEEIAGKLTGCQGMEREGQASTTHKNE